MLAMRAVWMSVVLVGACSFRISATGEQIVDGSTDGATDASADAMLGAWGTPSIVMGLAAVAVDSDVSLTDDMLEIYFRSNRAGSFSDDIWMSSRATTTSVWMPPINLGMVNSTVAEREPAISADGLTLRWSRPNGGGFHDVYVSRRVDRNPGTAWSFPAQVPELLNYYDAHEDRTGLVAVLSAMFTGNEQLYITTRGGPGEAFATPKLIGELNTLAIESGPYLYNGGRAICFDLDSSTTMGRDLYVASRPSGADVFGAPVPISELNSAAWDSDCWVSPDLRTIYFTSERSGQRELYVATR